MSVMKKIGVKTVILLVMLMVSSGCSVPKSSFVVSVPSGTHISRGTRINSNEIKVTTDADEYVGLLVATDSDSGLRIPFGVDYKRKVYHNDDVKAGVGMAMAFVGGISTIGGVALRAADGKESDDVAFCMILPGLGVLAGGGALASVGFKQMNLLSHDYHYTYEPVQRVNFDGISTTLAHVDPPKNAPKYSTTSTQKSSVPSYSTKAPAKGTSAKKSQSKELADQVIGTYSGSIKIMDGQETVASFSKATVELSRVDRSKVKGVIKLRGENFFKTDDSSFVATVIPEKNGRYTLKVEKEDDFVIKIDKSNTLRITMSIFDPNGERAVFSFSGTK